MSALPAAARLFVAATVAVGGALLVLFARWPIDRLPGLLALLAAAILTSTVKLHLPTMRNRATLSASFVTDFASLLIFGAHATTLIAATGALSQTVLLGRHRNPLHRTLFNIACLVITIEGTGLVYRAFGGSTDDLRWPSALTPVAAATITYFLVNTGMVALVISLATMQPVRRVWRHSFLWSGPNYFIGASVAAILVKMIALRLWTFIPLVAIPIYLTYRAYSVYARRLEEEHRHREIIESLNEGMAVLDQDGHVTLWNDALTRIVEISREHAIGRPLFEVLPDMAGTPLSGAVHRALTGGEAEVVGDCILHRTNGRRILHLRAFPYVGGVTLFWDDITVRAEAEAALKRSEERYALAASGANDGLWDWDLATDTIHFSDRWRALTGWSGTATGRPEDWFARIHPEDVASFKAALQVHVASDTQLFRHEHRVLHEDGAQRWVLCRGAAVRNADGKATRLAGSLTDVTEHVRTQEHLRRAALHDALTGLPNRVQFVEQLRQALDEARRRPSRQCAVLFLDIDRFKIINDSLGHQIGDELLVAISKRIASCLREFDTVARLGGDEFTVLLKQLPGGEEARAIVQRIQEAIHAPLLLQGREIFTSASIGIAMSVAGYENPDDIMRDADSAMYRAKARGKARYEFFDAGMHVEALDRLSFESDLRRAVERQELTLLYQPILSLDSGQVTALEALVRWNRKGSLVPPATFIPLAEELGLIESLGASVLREACQQFSEWRRRFREMPLAAITVNVSARQLLQPDFVALVHGALREARLDPEALHLEITETAVMQNPGIVEAVLRELRACGVRIYLDDFGTGFSSLSHLHRLPVDALKIDRSFVDSLTRRDRPAIVESILALARTLRTPVIAEGVETTEQLRELSRLGCAQAQGFLFSEPLSADDAEKFLAGQTRTTKAAQLVRSLARRQRTRSSEAATTVVVH